MACDEYLVLVQSDQVYLLLVKTKKRNFRKECGVGGGVLIRTDGDVGETRRQQMVKASGHETRCPGHRRPLYVAPVSARSTGDDSVSITIDRLKRGGE